MIVNLKDILTVSGQTGLFKFVAKGRNSLIAEHIGSGKRASFPSTAKINSLEDIALFTTGEDMKLGELFYRIHRKEEGGAALNHKSPSAELRSYFSDVVPEHDRDRVYASDIKKIVQWYNILQSEDMIELISDETDEPGTDNAAGTDEAGGSEVGGAEGKTDSPDEGDDADEMADEESREGS